MRLCRAPLQDEVIAQHRAVFVEGNLTGQTEPDFSSTLVDENALSLSQGILDLTGAVALTIHNVS